MTSRFLTPLEVEEVSDTAAQGRGFWRLTAPLTYSSKVLNRTVTVEKGFITDLQSTPRVPVVFMMLGDSANLASVAHDHLYRHPEIATKAQADSVLRELALSVGVPAWRVAGIYYGVKWFGQASYDADQKLGNGHSVVNGVIV